MTNELDKTFFNTFGIKPKTIIEPRYSLNTEYYEKKNETYPQITDHILLELICLINRELILVPKIRGKDLEELKNNILKKCIEDYNIYANSLFPSNTEVASNFKHQVRTLFEEKIYDRQG